MTRTTTAVLTVLVLAAHSSAQTTWHVDDDACPGPGSGTPGDPFCSIQDGIDAATDGDTVVVQPGSYDAISTFNGKAITVRSTDPTNDDVVSSTIIGGGSFFLDEGPESVLSGFFITGGTGISVFGSSPTIVRCTFSGNPGGGLWNGGGSPSVVSCKFVANGTGLHNDYGDVTVTNCTFSGNWGNQGGGVCSFGSIVITNCTFEGNMSFAGYGAAVFGDDGTIVRNCIVWEEQASPIAGGFPNPGPTVESSLVNGADPMFVDAANGDYRLQPGSPAIDAANLGLLPSDVTDLDGDGDVDELLPLDLGGNPRVQCVTVDMGAYEFDLCPDPTVDCNGNGVPDCDDISQGDSFDCNQNLVPDECEISDGTSLDCNGNGIPDECEMDPLTGFALEFDDESDRVTMAGYSGFPGTELTISYWQRTTGQEFTTVSYAAGGSDNQLTCFYSVGSLHIWIDQGYFSTPLNLNDGAWHHVAVTWRSDTGATVLYIDGEAVTTTTFQVGSTLQDGGVLVLGDEQDCVGGCFDPAQAFIGSMDELRLWNVARTAEEIAADRYVTLVGDEPGLVGYWPMDDGVGNVLEDLVGGNDGTISGAAWDATTASFDCCPADTDGSGAVDVVDLVNVILAWGSDDASADVNADGIVDVADLVEVILAWGPCV